MRESVPEEEMLREEREKRERAMEELKAEFQREIAWRDTAIEHLTRLAYTDDLTGLYNRRKFNEEFSRRNKDREGTAAEKEGAQDIFLLLDLDNFKIVNDAFDEGHVGGDRVLKEAARHLFEKIKDIFRKDDLVARYGGEEFAVLLKDADVEQIEKRLRLGLTVMLDKEHVPITFSGGYTVVEPGEDLSEVFARADRALFVAKEDEELPDGRIKRGRNRILPYSPEIENEIMEKREELAEE